MRDAATAVRRHTATALVLARLVNALGTGFALPFLTIYLVRVKDLPLTAAAAAVGASNLVGLCCSPAAGRLVTRLGPKRTAITALLGSAALYLALPATAGPAVLVVIALTGAAVALLRPAQQALIAVATPPARRHRAYAWAQAGVNVGLGLGGLAGSALVAGPTGHLTVVVAANATSFLLAAGLFALVPAPPPTPGRRPSAPTYRGLLAVPGMRALLLLHLVFFATVASAFTVGLPLHLLRAAPGAAAAAGLVFAANTAAVVALQGPALRLVAGRPRTAMLAASLLCCALAWTVLGTLSPVLRGSAAVALVLAAAVAVAAGECLYNPIVEPLVADLAPAAALGPAFAALTVARQLGTGIGPVAVGFLMQSAGTAGWLVLALGCLGGMPAIGRLGAVLRTDLLRTPEV
jgi:MFS family permease